MALVADAAAGPDGMRPGGRGVVRPATPGQQVDCRDL
jgi:hypothetical protein